ncbi:MAG: amidohydrolase family protein [Betaproteobacteria bacterium]
MMRIRFAGACALAGLLAAAGVRAQAPSLDDGSRAYTDMRLLDGTGREIDDAVLIVRNGRVEAVGSAVAVTIPHEMVRVDLAGRTVMPGLVNAHGHVGDTEGLEGGHYSAANVARDLRTYARYGVTTVFSLGGDGPPSFAARDAQNTPSLDRARIFVAGPVLAPRTPDEARKQVDEVAAMKANIVKIRVDDNLGTTPKMKPEIYRAVIDQAHQRGMRVAVHIFYLDDAKSVLDAGADFIAHSVRDKPVDAAFIDALKRRHVCYCPTLMREVSTYVYGTTPAFFSDPFFLEGADPRVVAALRDPDRQQAMRASREAREYKAGLAVAERNLKTLSDAGVTIAMGTDSGPPARFQGYFEQLELAEMTRAGLTPAQALAAGTRDAAACMRLGEVGTLEPGKWADFVVLRADPLADIRNTQKIEDVFIAGNRIAR